MKTMKIEKNAKDEWYFEISLIIITIGLACLMWKIAGFKLVVLNLFYLPVVLAGFFLGRYRAGVLASLAVIAASIVTALNLNDFAAYTTPLIVGLSVTLWAAVLGLTAYEQTDYALVANFSVDPRDLRLAADTGRVGRPAPAVRPRLFVRNRHY